MNLRLLLALVALGIIQLLLPAQTAALQTATHSMVNAAAVAESQLNDKLTAQLGVRDGIREKFLGQDVVAWISLGGAREDDGFAFSSRARFYRHFHDPLAAWDVAGLAAVGEEGFHAQSALRWAQATTQNSETGLGDYSWVNARAYFAQALTAETPAAREAAFAQTFRALGQVMHLLTDMSVPEHVRNDPHVLASILYALGVIGSYEYWALAQHSRVGTEAAFRETFLGPAPAVDPAVYAQPVPANEQLARVPIAFLFDSERYQGTNPAVTAEAVIGLAEVANANFFSEDTWNSRYPFPTAAPLETYRQRYTKTGFLRTYYRKAAPGLSVDPVAVRCSLQELVVNLLVCADDHVWRATARHLLPRAVRYSQELLDYFFRGELEVRRVLVPGTNQPSVRIINRSGEAIGPGTLTALVDDDQGVRTKVGGLTLNEAVPADNDEAPILLSVVPDASARPLMVVFTGQVGAEQAAVIGQLLPRVAVEQVYRDGTLNRWILRSAEGLYELPLEEAAGMAGPPAGVTWGERDNQLVGVTAPDGGESIEALLFEIRRPLRETAVPLQSEVGATGLPVVDLELVTRRAVASLLEGIDLGIQLTYTADLALAQAYVQETETYTCEYVESPAPIGYVCQLTRTASLSGPVPLGTHRIHFVEPLRLDRAHQSLWGESPAHYKWGLERIEADRDGRLIALVKLETTAPSMAEGSFQARTLDCDSSTGGAVAQTGLPKDVWKMMIEPAASVLALIDLTAGIILGVTSAEDIVIETDERILAAPVLCSSARTHYHGGPADGATIEGSPTLTVTYDPPVGELPVLTLRLNDPGHRLVRRWEGVFRPSLAAQGLGVLAPPMPGLESGESSVVLSGAVRVEGPEVLPLMFTPHDVINWSHWTGPAFGQLRLLTNRMDILAMALRTMVVEWGVATDRASRWEWTESAGFWEPVTATAQGTLLQWSGTPEAHALLWAATTGTAFELPAVAAPEAYVGLDPDYLYQVSDGRFHSLAAGFPAEMDPPLLAPGLDGVGSYHVVGR